MERIAHVDARQLCDWSEPALKSVARGFHILGEPVRLRLLEALASGERTVGQLVVATRSSQPNVSKHLRLLLNARMVERSKVGSSVYYSITNKSSLQIIRMMRAAV